MKTIELLSPARNADVGIEAINHGADAVYIGGPQFGARAAAGNDIDDIARLCRHAHTFGAKVYVTLNTILYDEELQQVEKLIWQLHQVGVDALIVQDLGLLSLNLPPIELHASTQLDITSLQKAKMLQDAGFRQIVLARELNSQQILEIHENCPQLILEAFVHGALCVSYSGRCYASQHCFNRSANRGQCAQFCRLPFEVRDADGRLVHSLCHPLSLKDMNRSNVIEEMLDSGITSFKIEGRLKDIAYVKNVTAFYRQQIDKIIQKRPHEFKRASRGAISLNFIPQLNKSFNRGFTDYFLKGKRELMASLESPKSKGEFIGTVAHFTSNGLYINLNKSVQLHAGDGLCFIDAEGTLQGFRINKIIAGANSKSCGIVLGPNRPSWHRSMSTLPAAVIHKIAVYRNFDIAFDQQLQKTTATRKLLVDFNLSLSDEGIVLNATDELNRSASQIITTEFQVANQPQQTNIVRQLMKLGDTPYILGNLNIAREVEQAFLPSSLLAIARREVVKQLLETPLSATAFDQTLRPAVTTNSTTTMVERVGYTANVANHASRKFYENLGAKHIEPAYELQKPDSKQPIMFCKYCLRHELGICLKTSRNTAQSTSGNLYLHSRDGQIFEVRFNCRKCEMEILPQA